MSSLTILGDTSGSVLLQAPAIAGSTTLTLPTVSGTLNVAGPAFFVYLNSTQTPSAGVPTKIQFNTEVFDTNNCFDTSTYRFTPTVAGYYQFTLGMSPSAGVSSAGVRFFRNGSLYLIGNDTNSNPNVIQGSALVYMNGTTDYVEGYAYVSTGGFFGNANQYYTYFQGCFLRGA